MNSKRNYFILLIIGVFFSAYAVFCLNLYNKRQNEDTHIIVDFSSEKQRPVNTSLESTCKPRRKVGFLKMHKCASSTLQNIFLRYAYINDLNAILPLKRWNYVGSPELFSLKLVEETPWHNLGYDIMAVHTRWNHSAVKEALGGGDPAFVTMIREPTQLFESLYGYFKFYKFLGNITLPEFLDKLEDTKFKRKMKYWRIQNNRYGRNQMLFDLGFPVKDFDNEIKVKQFVEETAINFDFVMITEKMEESIVLLKHLLCWEYKDLVFLKLNARHDSTKIKLSARQEKLLKNWLKADSLLYSKFRKIFDEKVEKFGYEKMEEEKRKLSSTIDQIVQRCLSGEKSLTNLLIKKVR
ncbi:hypothetical protein QYM36_014531 [Artemia franciscana]|nr:hypothetical protein QYM36_014531 [Artemia franciscana]